MTDPTPFARLMAAADEATTPVTFDPEALATALTVAFNDFISPGGTPTCVRMADMNVAVALFVSNAYFHVFESMDVDARRRAATDLGYRINHGMATAIYEAGR